MNRRTFLAWLGGTAAGVALAPTLDLDKLLWVPGEKTIFIPPAPTPVELWPHSLSIGDIFTIDGVYSVHPITGKSLPFAQKFVVTSNVTADEPFSVERISPRPMIDGPYKNISGRVKAAGIKPVTWNEFGFASGSH